MKTNELKNLIRETINKVLNEEISKPKDSTEIAKKLRALSQNKELSIDDRKKAQTLAYHVSHAKWGDQVKHSNQETYNEYYEEAKAFLKKHSKVSEAQPAPSQPKPSPGPAVAPGKPGTDKPKPRRPLGNPEVKPQPKNEALNEEEILQKIVARFKSKK